jgi:hypothetical protein
MRHRPWTRVSELIDPWGRVMSCKRRFCKRITLGWEAWRSLGLQRLECGVAGLTGGWLASPVHASNVTHGLLEHEMR